MGSGGLGFDAADVASAARLNQKTVFVGTGAQISGLGTTYAGQLAYCTSTGSGFTSDILYRRNTANSAWLPVSTPFNLGTSSDGATTISGNTDLGSSNNKNYSSLTINSGIVLQGNSGMIIRVSGALTFGNSSSQIHTNGKGGAGGTSVAGAGGGLLIVLCGSISGTGLLTSNGVAGTYNAGVTTATDGTAAQSYSINQTGSAGVGHNAGGGGGGACIGSGGNGDNTNGSSTAITSFAPSYFALTTGFTFQGAGGGGSSGGVGGGGAGGFVFLYCIGAIPALTMQATGGAGTNNASTTKSGGGGGGACIALTNSTDSSTKTVTGGTGGGSPAANGGTGLTASVLL